MTIIVFIWTTVHAWNMFWANVTWCGHAHFGMALQVYILLPHICSQSQANIFIFLLLFFDDVILSKKYFKKIKIKMLIMQYMLIIHLWHTIVMFIYFRLSSFVKFVTADFHIGLHICCINHAHIYEIYLFFAM